MFRPSTADTSFSTSFCAACASPFIVFFTAPTCCRVLPASDTSAKYSRENSSYDKLCSSSISFTPSTSSVILPSCIARKIPLVIRSLGSRLSLSRILNAAAAMFSFTSKGKPTSVESAFDDICFKRLPAFTFSSGNASKTSVAFLNVSLGVFCFTSFVFSAAILAFLARLNSACANISFALLARFTFSACIGKLSNPPVPPAIKPAFTTLFVSISSCIPVSTRTCSCTAP